jgi:VCBS repeat-containing protein
MHHPDFNLKRAPSVDQAQFPYLSMPLKNKFYIFIASLLLLMNGNRVEAGASASIDDYSISEDSVLNVANTGDGLLNNDTTDGSSLNVISIDTASLTTKGAVTFNSDETFTYDPTGVATFQALNNSQTASDSFKYTVQDSGGDSDTATVTGTGINDSPIASGDSDSTTESNLLSVDVANGLLSNDTDPDGGDVLTVSSSDTSSSKGADVSVLSDGSYSYDPGSSTTLNALAAGETVVATFQYTISDGNGKTASETIGITVTGVNDAPTTVADIGAITENTALNVDVSNGLLSNDTDPDRSDVLTVSSSDASSDKGAGVSVSSDGSYSYDPGSSTTLNALAAGETVVDAFQYTISDGNGKTATETVSITVTGVNDVPEAVEDSVSINEDEQIDVFVLNNDSDPDAGEKDLLRISQVTSPENGTAEISAD